MTFNELSKRLSKLVSSFMEGGRWVYFLLAAGLLLVVLSIPGIGIVLGLIILVVIVWLIYQWLKSA